MQSRSHTCNPHGRTSAAFAHPISLNIKVCRDDESWCNVTDADGPAQQASERASDYSWNFVIFK